VKVLVFPADSYGCGYHRLIWPVEVLRAQGHDVQVVPQEARQLQVHVNSIGQVVGVDLADEYDVVVLQRVTHENLVGVIDVLRERGTAVVVDVDDDLSTIHPANPAWPMLHPRLEKDGAAKQHSWRNLDAACQAATLVTATTPALTARYAPHGRARVFANYLAAHYYGHERVDSDLVGWPASLASHPNDPDVVGSAVARLVDDGANFHVVSVASGVARAFSIRDETRITQVDGVVSLLDWPAEIAKLGIGIAPLADTKFNHSKSWLKPLELAAVGVPWVGSPRAEYRRLHELGCGVLCDKPSSWYGTLRRLRRDASWRADLSTVGRLVADELRLDKNAWRLWEAWSDALAIQRGQRTSVAV
jgi:putative intracellular protease/amidase